MITLIGERREETTDFQPAGELEPMNVSGAWSSNSVLISRNANAKSRKKKTNLALDTCIVLAY